MSNLENHALWNWNNLYPLPDFSKIKEEEFEDCFDYALKKANEELENLAVNDQKNIDDFLVSYELSGEKLNRFCSIFWLYVGANSTEKIQKCETEFSKKLSAFSLKWMQNKRLFQKIENLYHKSCQNNFDKETQRALEKHYKAYLSSAILLSPEEKEKLCQIEEKKTILQTKFSQNVLKDEAEWVLFLEENDLDGLPTDLKESMKEFAKEKGKEDKYALNLSRSMVEPFLSFSKRRDLRQILFEAFTKRGDFGNSHDNKEILSKILKLRQEKAVLLGYKDFAHFKIERMMAKKTENVLDLLNPIWEKACQKAQEEYKKLEKIVQEDGLNSPLKGYDWHYYAEKLRIREYSFHEADIRPYFELNSIMQAAFAVANKLFGLFFKEEKNFPLWHKDARLFSVFDCEKNIVGYFAADYFSRPTKRSGAWMSSLQVQHKLTENAYPIVYNICNFNKAISGKKNLLSLQDAKTLFHEFGHALHGLLSNVTWPSVSGTNVARDFVELPSQLYEHWLMSDFVLKNYACHESTGRTMPEDLLQKFLKSKHFNAGFDAVEFISSAITDILLHEYKGELDATLFEKDIRSKLKMPEAIEMRHRMPHFNHIFANDGYAAGYYSYMWSEVLDADAFHAFEEKNDLFDKELANRLKTYIYSAGASQDPEELYKKFRGKKPDPSALIQKRGL